MASKKSLVIVESPGKIKTISKVLGKGYVVKASVGHVRDLPKGKKASKKNGIVVGIGSDFSPHYVPLEKKKKIISALKKATQSAERIYLCPDPDREGEAIAWHLKEALKLDPKKTYRVTFDEITPRGIRAGFAKPRQIDMDLVNAQQARRVLDRIVGYKLSPLLSAKMGGWLTAGRVQSVAVKMIVLREREIEAHQYKEYWTLGAKFHFADKMFDAELRGLDGRQVVTSSEDYAKFSKQDARLSSSGILRTVIASAAEAQELTEILRESAYQVSQHEVKEVRDRPYPPFATSQLQQNAASKLGFHAKRTMRVAQGLYQGVPLGERGPVALITYMRTDSFRISPDALNESRAFIAGEQRFGPPYVPEKPNVYRSRKGGQDAHECIRPTHVDLTPEAVKPYLKDEQFKLYRLIWRRFVASQMRPAIFDATTCDLAALDKKARHAVFRATGRVLKFAGWLAVYGAGEAEASSHLDAPAADREKGDEAGNGREGAAGKSAKKKSVQTLPLMKVGDQPKWKALDVAQRFTQPPRRYNEGSLVKTLEQKGIGRPSTYATIVSTIQDRGYVEKMTEKLDLPAQLVGRRVRSRSAEGVVVKISGGRLRLRTERGFEFSVPKDRSLALWDDTGAPASDPKPVTASLQKVSGGYGAFVPTALGMAVNDRLEDHFSRSVMKIEFTREIEDDLDQIEDAHRDWRQVLKEFYGPFTLDLEKAAKGMIVTKGQAEPTDVACPECGAPMGKLFSRYGYYLRCSRHPDCKATRHLDHKGNIKEREQPQATGIKCDLCGSDVVKTSGRFGPYLCCVRYLDKACTFTMKLNKEGHPKRKFAPLPTDLKCEKCQAPLVVRVSARGKKRRPFLSCSKFPKCRAAQDLPEELAELGQQAMKIWEQLQTKDQADLEVYLTTQARQEEALAALPENA